MQDIQYGEGGKMKKLILSGILALFLVATTIMAGVEWMPNNRFIKMCHIADVNDDKIVNAFDLTKVRFNYQKNCSKEKRKASSEKTNCCFFVGKKK